ncbi:hypothetical protein NDU88_010480 [Pleurodeles waltl]|uniref:Uncharacterized protein n=1 Tax=Pleurodeles waltl TaxID=8319 RepID=A0AAV7S1I1_PLEWA|nr:hypothetical protein NDU88_010480 [Pleurodeles waltl]
MRAGAAGPGGPGAITLLEPGGGRECQQGERGPLGGVVQSEGTAMTPERVLLPWMALDDCDTTWRIGRLSWFA